MHKQYKILTIVMLATIIIQIVIFAFMVKEITERQIETSARIEFIHNYCLE